MSSLLLKKNILIKRIFDILLAFLILVLTFWLIILSFIIASLETKSFGIFHQQRIGKNGKKFMLYKIKTMKDFYSQHHVSTDNDKRITNSGMLFRKSKIDELPQLINILLGDMSFVGPRPDVPGYADSLKNEEKLILKIKPGLTGPASIKYRNESLLLNSKKNPIDYNDKIIWPDKVFINIKYIKNWSLITDIKYILITIKLTIFDLLKI